VHPRTRRELGSGILTRGENTLAPGQQKPASLRQDAPQPPLDRFGRCAVQSWLAEARTHTLAHWLRSWHGWRLAGLPRLSDTIRNPICTPTACAGWRYNAPGDTARIESSSGRKPCDKRARRHSRKRLPIKPGFHPVATYSTPLETGKQKAHSEAISGSSRKLGSGASREVGVLHHGGHRV
jgi:hypothetical protein